MTAGVSEAERSTLDTALTTVRDDSGAPDLRGALYQGGELLWSFEHGDASQFRIGSISKTFTAAAVLRLHERGRVDLDERLGHYVADAPYADSTIRDLLSHRSGMTAEPSGPWWERTPGVAWSELVDANTPPTYVHPPSVRHHYSNLGYALLGRLVEELSGSAWFDAISSAFLEPLQMADTTYGPGPGAATGTSRSPVTGRLYAEPAQDTVAMAPAGQLWSTTDDLARWGQVLLGREPLLSPATVQQMCTCHAVDPDSQHLGGYGLGLRLRWQSDGTMVGHTGSMPGFLAGLFVQPRTDRCGVVMANVTTGIGTEQVVADMFSAVEARAAIHRPVARPDGQWLAVVDDLVGDWYWGNTAMRVEVAADGFDLVSGGERRRFRASGPDRFVGRDGYYAGETLTVLRRGDGSVGHLEVVTFVFTRSPYDGEAPIPGGLPAALD